MLICEHYRQPKEAFVVGSLTSGRCAGELASYRWIHANDGSADEHWPPIAPQSNLNH